MPGTRFLLHLTAFLALGSGLLSAADGPAPLVLTGTRTNWPSFAAEVRHEEGPGVFPTERAYVMIGTNRCAFVVPAGLHLSVPVQNDVTLLSADFDSILTVRVVDRPGVDPGDPTPTALRGSLLYEHPGAAILDTFSLVAEGRRGPALDAGWSDPGGISRRVRVTWIPAPGGLLEFCVVCPAKDFAECQRRLSTVLLTFRSADASGKLHLPVLSDKL